MHKSVRTSFAYLLLLVLAACQRHHDAPPSGDTPPELAVRESVDLLGKGDFSGFWKHALPPADFANLRADWPRREGVLDDVDRRRLDTALRQLAASNASARLWTDVRPFVLHYERDYKDDMPLSVGIMQSMAITAIGQARSLTNTQKDFARETVLALAPWAQGAPWGDTVRAHKAIAIATTEGASLQLPADGTAASFDASMRNQAIAWHALRAMLDVYNLPLDDMFASASTESLETTDGSARVRVHYTLLDKPLSIDISMVREDGHWYDRDLLTAVRANHDDLSRTPPAAAMASDAPAASTSGAAR
jgi:hypothetical protein